MILYRNRLIASLSALIVMGLVFVADLGLAQNAGGANSVQQSNVDPDRLAAAKEMMVVVGSAKQFDTIFPLLTQQLEAAFLKLKPEHSAEIKNVFKQIPVRFSEKKYELLDQISALYARTFTTDELKQITAFYKSPIGMKFTQMMPSLMQESMTIGQAWGQKIGQEIEADALNQLRGRGIPI